VKSAGEHVTAVILWYCSTTAWQIRSTSHTNGYTFIFVHQPDFIYVADLRLDNICRFICSL